MSQTKKVVVSLAAEDYSFLEGLSESGSAEEYIKILVEKDIKKQRLKSGYAEMAQINLELAQMCFDADEECVRQYEDKLKK